MKRILYIVTRAVTAGGVMSVVSKKINYLSEQGYKITLLSMTRCEEPFYELSSNIELVSCTHNDGMSASLSDLMFSIRFIRSHQFDVIVSADAQYITWLLPLITSTPTVLELHQSYDGLVEFYRRSRFPKLNVFLHKIMQKFCYSMYKRVVVLTEEDKEKWKLNNCMVIPNFHDRQIVEIIQCKKKKIVCLGRFHYQKGYDLLIAIWKKLALQFPDWELHYYGVDEDNNVKRELLKLGAPSSFKIMGFEKDQDIIFGDAYLNIVPSRNESFSLTIIEAMTYGVPSVSFSSTGPKSIIHSGIDGELVSNFDIDRASCAIERLINDKEYYNIMSGRCIVSASNYSKNTIMHKWESLFLTCMKD